MILTDEQLKSLNEAMEKLAFEKYKFAIKPRYNMQIFKSGFESAIQELSKLHQPAVISSVCDCKLLGNRKQYEFNLNECRLCGKQLKAN